MEDRAEIERRKTIALAAIKKGFGTAGDEFGATLFVSHHLEEVEAPYWEAHLGTAQPQPHRVLDLLELRSHWSEEDKDDDEEGIDVFDFTLPGGVTDYVISVRFGENGEVEEIAMES